MEARPGETIKGSSPLGKIAMGSGIWGKLGESGSQNIVMQDQSCLATGLYKL